MFVELKSNPLFLSNKLIAWLHWRWIMKYTLEDACVFMQSDPSVHTYVMVALTLSCAGLQHQLNERLTDNAAIYQSKQPSGWLLV